MQQNQLKIVYLDKQFVTVNQAAIATIRSFGRPYVFASTCESDLTAVPEWFDSQLFASQAPNYHAE
jgi:hypothetical protein